MSSYTLAQKAEASLRLLLGLRLPAIQQQLAPYGFDEAALEVGLGHLRELVLSRGLPGVRVTDDGVGRVAELEEFCQKWFPIARYALKSAYPEVGEALFQGLRRPEGAEALTVTTLFLDWLDALEAGERAWGKDARAAARLLESRGLRAGERRAARELLGTFVQREPASPAIAQSLEREAQALERLWNWQLEWSAVARKAIKRRNQRQALGFAAPNKSKSK